MHRSLHLLMIALIILFFLSLSLGLTVNAGLCSVNATNEESKPSILEAEKNWQSQETRDQLGWIFFRPADRLKDVDSGSPSVLERLWNDYECGRISIDQYMLYEAWTVFAPDRLSSTEYALSSEELVAYRKCGSMIVLEIKRNWHRLSLDVQNQLFWLLERPTDSHILPQLYTSLGGHFVLHWTNGADGGKAGDAATLAYVQTFAGIFDNVWNFEINTRGYLAPPDDTNNPPNDPPNNRNPDGKYDVFIYDMTAYGSTVAEQATAPSISYIKVENDYNGFPGTQLGCMQVTAAHEFFHAIHFCYDLNEPLWWYEATATYMEDEIYPNVNDNYQYLPDWFQNCDSLGLESTAGLHEYGDFIFTKRLSEDFGDAVIREIWTEMQATNGLTAINNVLTSKGSSMKSEFNNFTIANFFLEDMYADGVSYRSALTRPKTTFGGVYLEYQYKEATNGLPFTINSTNVKRNAWMDKWAADYITITMSGATSSYIISFDGLDDATQYDVSLVTKVKGGTPTEQDFTLNSHKDGRVELAYNSQYANVTLIIRNSGDTSTKTPSWRVIIAPKRTYEVTFYTTPALDQATITFDKILYTNDQTGSYNSGDYTATTKLPNPDYVFDHWEYNGFSSSGVYVPTKNANPTKVEVRGNGWLRAVFKAIAYKVTVRTSGLSYSSYSTHVYADDIDQDTPYLYDGNSRTFTFAVGETHTISVDAYVVSPWSEEERHSCPSNSTEVDTDETIIFEYHEENLVTFEQQDCEVTPHVTVDDVTYSLPCDLWLDAEVEHTFQYESPIAVDTGVRYVISSTYPTYSPYTFTYSTTVTGYYKTQFFITVNSDHGAPTDSKWVNKESFLTVSVASPAETVEDQARWICKGYKVDEGELKQGTSCYFSGVNAAHEIDFYWVQQFWLQADTDITGPHVEGTGWYDANSSAAISVTGLHQLSSTHQFILTSWASTGTNTAQITNPKSSSTTVTMGNYYSIEAKWQEQWYVTVNSERGNPTPPQWVNASKSFSIYVTSPTDDDGRGTRYRCTGYTIDYEGTQEGTSYTFGNVQASHTIMFRWAVQYQLIVSIDPAGLSPQPNTSLVGPWHDDFTTVTLTAQGIDGYTFDHWSVDGANQGGGISSITVSMYEPQTAIAYYKPVVFTWQLYLIASFVVLAVVIGTVLLVRRGRRKKF